MLAFSKTIQKHAEGWTHSLKPSAGTTGGSATAAMEPPRNVSCAAVTTEHPTNEDDPKISQAYSSIATQVSIIPTTKTNRNHLI